jgi:hypothetical protein
MINGLENGVLPTAGYLRIADLVTKPGRHGLFPF